MRYFHQDLIIAPTVEERTAAQSARFAEAGFEVCLTCALVETPVPQVDGIQVQKGEPVVAHHPHRFAAVPFAPDGFVADGDPQFGALTIYG